jgi:hypothetical protein
MSELVRAKYGVRVEVQSTGEATAPKEPVPASMVLDVWGRLQVHPADLKHQVHHNYHCPFEILLFSHKLTHH